LIQRLLHEYGALHGIIHAAGVNRDSYLTNKTADELAAVLAPKVSGTLNLDEATRHIELDFFVLCSSGTGTFGNVGQADYATANAWLDCFAEHRNEQVNSGQRRGHTLSMIWPLWADGGMSVGRETQTMLERRLGMVLMPSAIGMKALYAGLNSGSSHLFVMQGHWEHMTRALELADQSPLARQTKVRRPSGTQQNAAGALLRMQSDLIAIAAEMLSLGAEQISLEEELSKYGFDSILLTDFANKLNQRFGTELAPTIFFEHPTLGEFARYLVETTGAKEESLSAEVESVEAAADSAPATGRFFASPAGVEHKSAQSFEDGQSMARGALAIVGMSGVFPQAENIPELWRILLEGRDCITEVPAERWSWRETAREANLEARSGAVRWGGFIDDMDGFDARFFRISPKEAELMDPQQRLMMTHAYRAIEDAGYSPKGLSGRKFGIFIGTGNTGYASLIDESEAATDSYSSTGLIPSLGPNRMSFFLNWHGPSEPVETACSSSLVAVHRAYAEIMSGNCEAALVGGVNTLVTPDAYVRYGKAGMLAPDGRCKTFSAHANGYVRGEGVGILFLKRLEDAERDGDHIYALIRGSGVNHGGRANSLTAPNAKAQADLLKSVYFQAGISPATVGYIEAHGTGTELGDPVEINGLTAAFKDLTTKEALRAAKPYCGLGSIKSNIGHLELAAGVAGIIKTVLQLQHATLVASLHCEEPNPYLPLANSPFYLVRENQPWPALQDENGAPLPRRAGVSSFGFGGTNAHVILEEYIPRAKSEPRHSRPVIVPLSARTRPQLREAVWNLLRFVEREPAQSVERIAYTLQVGRDAFEERLGLIVSSVEELRSKLESALAVWETPALAELSGVKSGSVKEAGDRASWFSTDEDLKQVVVKWLEARQFERVLNLWTGGADLDWKRAYGQSTPRRLSLPTYPFSSERFWIQSAPSESRAPVAPSTDLKVFTPIWSSDPAAPQENDCPRAKARVLVVGGAAEQQERMQRDFVHCTVLSLERDETAESIRERLRGAGGSAGEEWAHVVWFGRARASADLTLESPSDGVMQVFALAKAFVAEGYGERDLGWTFITAKSLNVLEHEAAAPADASVHGFVVSLAKEFPSWSVRLVDLESQPSWPGEDLWRLPRSTDNAYAYRRGNWFRQSLAAVEQTNNFPAPYRDGGVYVVVGGAGGLGVLWSRHVIERHRAQVYWIGRRALDASIEQQIAQLARLGPAPVYIQADASQRSQLEHAYQQIRQAHPVIHGVIHSAVGDFDRSVIDYDAATFRAILAGKIDVAVTLAEVFGRESLDFLLFFSSMASFARSGGMSAYTAGCVFKDAFAHWLSRHLRLPAKVVNWGYWTVGSGERISDAMKIRLQQEGVEAIDAAEGMLALERFLSGPLTQISVWRAAPTHELPLGSEDAEIVTVYPNEIAPMLEPVE
jgi:acyl transferase domain-containing protein/acyl carrier protein